MLPHMASRQCTCAAVALAFCPVQCVSWCFHQRIFSACPSTSMQVLLAAQCFHASSDIAGSQASSWCTSKRLCAVVSCSMTLACQTTLRKGSSPCGGVVVGVQKAAAGVLHYYCTVLCRLDGVEGILRGTACSACGLLVMALPWTWEFVHNLPLRGAKVMGTESMSRCCRCEGSNLGGMPGTACWCAHLEGAI